MPKIYMKVSQGFRRVHSHRSSGHDFPGVFLGIQWASNITKFSSGIEIKYSHMGSYDNVLPDFNRNMNHDEHGMIMKLMQCHYYAYYFALSLWRVRSLSKMIGDYIEQQNILLLILHSNDFCAVKYIHK